MQLLRLMLDLNSVLMRVDLPSPLSPREREREREREGGGRAGGRKTEGR